METLQLAVQESELRDLDMDRVVFPLEGMACCVQGCDSIIYKTFKKYMEHWKARHVPTVPKFGCVVCRRQFNSRPHATSCIKRHPYDGDFFKLLADYASAK